MSDLYAALSLALGDGNPEVGAFVINAAIALGMVIVFAHMDGKP